MRLNFGFKHKILYIVATPIGNLKDITLRALELLRSVDFILCEDQKVSSKLLSHYKIKKTLITFNEHSSENKLAEILKLLKKGANLALMTDAGSPGISDPGGKLIQYIYEHGSDIKIVPIPGPSAVSTALSISGFSANEYLFLGYPPHKRRRKKFFHKIAAYENSCVIFESPHRIKKTLTELALALKNQKRKIVLCRELTKKFEEIIRGDLNEVVQKFLIGGIIKGEFTIVIGPTEKS